MGHEGRAMDEMIEHERPFAVVDLSLHEITDHLFGGDYDAGADRRKAALSAGIPTVLVPGNADFPVIGPLEDARNRFPGRAYHVHNAAIKHFPHLMRKWRFWENTCAKLCNKQKALIACWFPWEDFRLLILRGACGTLEAVRCS